MEPFFISRQANFLIEMRNTIEESLQGKNSTQQTALSHETGRIEVISRSTLLGKEIDVYGSAENPLFRAKDVAEWIEHSDVSTLLRVVDEEEKLTQTLFVSGQDRDVWFLTEDGLYEVLMQSRKPIAKQFKKGIKEILKSIRKTGTYSVQKQFEIPQSFSEALLLAAKQAQQIEEQQKQIARRDEQIAQDAPRVLFSKAVETAKRSCLGGRVGEDTTAERRADRSESPLRMVA